MDRGAWQTTVCGVARVRHELVTKLLWNLSVYSHFLLQATHFSLVKTRGLDWNLTSSKSRIMKCQCTERVYSGTFDFVTLQHIQKRLILVWHSRKPFRIEGTALRPLRFNFSTHLWWSLNLENHRFILISFHMEKLKQIYNNPINYSKVYGINVLSIVILAYYLISFPQFVPLQFIFYTAARNFLKTYRFDHVSAHFPFHCSSDKDPCSLLQ